MCSLSSCPKVTEGLSSLTSIVNCICSSANPNGNIKYCTGYKLSGALHKAFSICTDKISSCAFGYKRALKASKGSGGSKTRQVGDRRGYVTCARGVKEPAV